MRKVNIGAGLVITVLSIAGFIYAGKTSTPSQAGLASNTFPQFLLVCLGICGVVLAATSYFKKSDAEAELHVEWKTFLPVLVVLGVYVFLFKKVHFIISSVIFLAIELWLFGNRNWKVIIPVAILAPVIIYFLFTKAFHIILPS